MTKDKPRNLAASVRQRLLNLARERHEDFQFVLIRFALERLLYRLSRSEHRDVFALKGAMLFQLWSEQPYRPTRDLDLLGHGEISIRYEEMQLKKTKSTRAYASPLLVDCSKHASQFRSTLVLAM